MEHARHDPGHHGDLGMTAYSGIGAALEQAAETWPDKAAYRFRGEVLTYSQLWSEAKAVGAALVSQGVHKGDRVAVAMTKGLEMPVALHAIWMAGAAFVPFDPTSPIARLAGIIDDCGIQVIVTAPRSRKLAEALAEARPVTLVSVGGQAAAPAFELVGNSDEELAYIIFTSGSTGAPKGICHTHASGRAFAEAWRGTYGLTAEDVFFSTVPLHFDFSLADFFAPSDVGATTELVPEQMLAFPASVAELLETSGGTIWSSVPYTFTQLCERGAVEKRDLSRLRWLIYGGEPMPPSALPILRRVFSGARISNSYGPAEVNQVTEYTVPEDHPADRPIPIGNPTSQATLADDGAGELLVAGPSMMQGYWNRPDLNARAFIELDGQRYYRTGDRVTRDKDGLWMFSGREDRLVKIRGHRIELDEVELALAAHDAVSEAAVIKAPDGLALRAFVTLVPGVSVGETDLRKHLASLLPGYALPDRIEIRPTLAKTSTGKINRKALSEETT
jgi:amino acid adenylation domain-containing protein